MATNPDESSPATSTSSSGDSSSVRRRLGHDTLDSLRRSTQELVCETSPNSLDIVARTTKLQGALGTEWKRHLVEMRSNIVDETSYE